MASMKAPFKHLSVIGFGLIGGSFAMAARSVYPDLWIQAIDPSSQTLQYVLHHEIINEASLTLPDSFADDHLIVLATHLNQSLDILAQVAHRVENKPIVVTDIGSCKRAICSRGETLLPHQFIGGHPLAGKEKSGIEYASALLFTGKPYVLCPSASVFSGHLQANQHYEQLKLFLNGLGVHLKTLDPDSHDRYMAYMSHFPQLYAILLTNLLYQHEPGRMLGFHGGGIDDQMRLSASPYPMWRDVFEQNHDYITQVLREFQTLTAESLQALGAVDPAGALKQDKAKMNLWFDRAHRIHQEFYQTRGQT
ncbi:MAG: prephenate dehydrogenase/arogenate dehydrogenase family protein [Cyanobacteria bacterium]|nr:prephenate dehydrogenase/arogenate dehydrogenase family protein [Cyanobacteriota bacterium]